jgi:integrase
MARRPTGQLVVRRRARDTVYAVRVRVGGERRYVTLGRASDGMTEARAREEVANLLADVRRGLWRPPAPEPVVEPPRAEPTFHEFASEWYAAREAEGLAAKTLADFRWSLTGHLLPFFAGYRLGEVTPQLVDAYKVAKARERAEVEAAGARGERLAERGLSNGSINHTLRHLAQILEVAVEYGLVGSNPASGRRRRLKAARPSRPWVEPEQLMALLDAAPRGVGRVLLALLAGAGLRIGEALALRWQHVDLGTGTLYVVDAKTAKGVREVHLTPALREELALWRADARHVAPADYVVATSTGGRHNPSNLRRDVLARAVAAANAALAEAGIAPIGPVTFHSLRRTYASLRCAVGDDVRYTADQLGHEDPRFTLKVYAQATKRRDRLTGPHLRAYDRALEWALMGTTGLLAVPAASMEATENPA